jgi:hypothetical protein
VPEERGPTGGATAVTGLEVREESAGQRVGWIFSPVGERKSRMIEVIATRAERTKAAYLLLT